MVIDYNKEKNSTFFSSDLHLHHSKIIDYCNRPYSSEEEMTSTIISNWNSVINKSSTVYLLGDVIFKVPTEKAINTISQLNGKIHLILGNHDGEINKVAHLFSSISQYTELKIDLQEEHYKTLVLFHYPINSWNKKSHGSWHGYGHIHSAKDKYPTDYSWDLGVDNNNYFPVSLEHLKSIMDMKARRNLEDAETLEKYIQHFKSSVPLPKD